MWGPAPYTSKNNFSYFLLFVDHCTRMTWVFFLKQKSEVFDKFVSFYNLIQTQLQKQIQVLKSDNGGEFINNAMKQFFRDKGLIHQNNMSPYPATKWRC